MLVLGLGIFTKRITGINNLAGIGTETYGSKATKRGIRTEEQVVI